MTTPGEHRVAVVTGSTRGIGLGLARELHARGCAVVVSGRSPGTVSAAVERLGGGERLHGIACDVTEAADVKGLWQAAVSRFGRVDIWINNAGSTTTPVPVWTIPATQVAGTVATNLIGSLYGLQVAAEGMRQQEGGGHIFTVEGLGSEGEMQEGLLVYGATKAAVAYARKALARELKGTEVKVSYIRPGINVTDHLLFDAEALSPETWQRTKRVFNILGDFPETTTPFLADGILRARRSGTRIAWLNNRKAGWRFMTAPLRKRDLFAGLEPAGPGSE